MIPSTYQGFKVEMVISGHNDEIEWDFGDRYVIPYKVASDPQKYVDFVNRCEDEIKEKLKSPDMTNSEILDAIC